MPPSWSREVSHYVVTSHPPGGVLKSVKCNFLSKESEDIVIAKSRRLEVRQLRQEEEDAASPFPVVFSCPINGRITSLVPLTLSYHETALLFLTTDKYQYAVIGYSDPGGIQTFASGSLRDDWAVLGSLSECGPLVTVDPHMRCIVLHLFDGLVSVFPILPPLPKSSRSNVSNKILGPVFHARLEERTLLAICMLHHSDPSQSMPHLTLLHQDSRGAQHITTHVVDLARSQLWSITSAAGQNLQCEWLKKSRIDGGSSLLIAVPPSVAPVATAASAAVAAANTSASSFSGGIVVLGQRQITYCAMHQYKVMPIPPALILSWDALPPDASGMPRFLLGDEFGNLHLLTLLMHSALVTTTQDNSNKVVALQLDTLGSCTLASSIKYLDQGLVFCGSTLGDSQLIQIHDEPIPVDDEEDMDDPTATTSHRGLELGETTYLSVVEEYTHLGPIVDFDLVPMAGNAEQCQVVTASGSSKSGSIRVIRNGIGMKEYASVELSGIQNMWSLRKNFDDAQDTYLVQSFVGETRVLGVTAVDGMDDSTSGKDPMVDENEGEGGDEDNVGGTLEEVVLPGLESNASTLHITNLTGNLILQITETQLRLINTDGELLNSLQPESPMTVATSNEAGQVLVALRGGKILYLEIRQDKLHQVASKQMDREVSCLDVHPFLTEDSDLRPHSTTRASICAVGLWDDFTVRLLTLSSNLQEVLIIHLSTEDEQNQVEGQRRNNRNNMMARSLCLVTLDFASSAGGGNNSSKKLTMSKGVDMLFVGLGDGNLVSFAVVQEDGQVRAQSKKEVSLGTQRINLIPLQNEKGGTCVLATGDRPTVIYLTGTSTAQNYNPKLCYSNVNLSPADDADHNDVSRTHTQESIAVNVAAPFFSPLLFDAMGHEHYSLCVADDVNLRLGVIDDIQKLHVTTCRLGMAPRRIVHCPEGHLFAVGCIESGIKQVGMGGGEMNMGNCIRFLDDDTFDDIERIDLEPCEMVLSMVSATMQVQRQSVTATVSGDGMDTAEATIEYKPFLFVGTGYALHDEDEPTKGRVMVFSCDQDTNPNKRTVKLVSELQVRGGVYSMCQFFDGKILVTVNSKTQMCQIIEEGAGIYKINTIGVGHHGHILSLFVSSRAPKHLGMLHSGNIDSIADSQAEEIQEKEEPQTKEQLAIVGDLMRSISLVQYYPEHSTLEEVARDFNANWTTAVSMLTDDVYLGGENWNNLYVLRRNTKATSEEVRCRLDTVGEFHLGEMVNKFMSGSLVMPTNNDAASTSSNTNHSRRRSLTSPKKSNNNSKLPASPRGTGTASAVRSKRPLVSIGSQTLFGTVEGTLGCILGLDGPTTAFFSCLERAMQNIVKPVGNFSHQRFRAFDVEQRHHPCHGFIDGDLIESFLDLDKATMVKVVKEMNRDGGWEADDAAFSNGASNSEKEESMIDDTRPELAVEDVLAVVEEMAMLH